MHHNCEQEPKHYCLVKNFTIETEVDANSFTIDSQSVALRFDDPIITYFPPELMDNPAFNAMRYLIIKDGKVPEMHLKPTLIALIAKGNQMKTFAIPAVDNIRLSGLSITENQLTEIPTNIKYCKKLEDLTLSENKLKTVNLSVLNGLRRLRYLSLGFNQIHSVDATTIVRIPSLEYLTLRENQLHLLDMKKWRLPRLFQLDVSSNVLNRIEAAVEQFPSMRVLDQSGNPWNCTWLKDMFKSYDGKGVRIVGDVDERCSGPTVRGICCLE